MPKFILRTQHEDDVYYVRNICIQQSFLMLPKERINQAIAGALARATHLHKVRIYAFTFLPNRFEMLLSAPLLNLPEFMKSMQQEIAEELNFIIKREGKFFERCYQKSEVRGKQALLERFSAITCAAITDGLAAAPDDWAGVSSWPFYLSGETFRGMSINRTRLGELKRRAKNKQKLFILPPDAGQEHYQFQLTRLPGFKSQSRAKHNAFIKRAVSEYAEKLRQAGAIRVIDIEKLKTMHWSTRPADLDAQSQNPTKREPHRYQLCYGTPAIRAAHLQEYKSLCQAYARAMQAYVEEFDASQFPARTCRPGLISCEKPDGWQQAA